ncbi:ExbD/TolR family protein [Methylomagnum ishizawai]|uniref:ExbD/TolR family protein n=1 Tax=Methylomagnum ishizawai TaxID=1760988 RepID=UPI001C33F9B4|nr:biopolymer transporter ExbD [Methylomagnum ishizawai]BBL74534.1 biopolymer transporter ExbD [Methylomagnum ishizawai]
MNFRPRRRETPELNLIPMIDVLIVLLIFLVLTTTFSREAELKIHLPEATGTDPSEDPGIEVVVDAEGRYVIEHRQTVNNQPETVKKALRLAVGERKDPLIVIDADKDATHQAVMTVLDVASQLGYRHVTFNAMHEPGGTAGGKP